MDLNTVEILKKKLLDVQENVRDFQEYSRRMESEEVKCAFKDFAEENAMQARKLQHLIEEWEDK